MVRLPSGAMDQHGGVLDILVQDRRNAAAAKRFFRRLLAGLKYNTDLMGLLKKRSCLDSLLPLGRRWRCWHNRSDGSRSCS
jgi:hypothetical protein